MSGIFQRLNKAGQRYQPGDPQFRKNRYACSAPFEFDHQGEIYSRRCGWCAGCIATKKRDLSGRAAAEAAVSSELWVFTLTYRDVPAQHPSDGRPWVGERTVPAGAKAFSTRDRQIFLKRVRREIERDAERQVGAPARWRRSPEAGEWRKRIAERIARVRYFGVGEKGDRNDRCHFHIALFIDKPGFSGAGRLVQASPKKANGRMFGDDHPWWSHGMTTIDIIRREDGVDRMMKAVYYITSYLHKTKQPARAEKVRGAEREACFFRSTATPLGHDFLIEDAKAYARAGLPLQGVYRVRGARASGGRFELTRFRLSGAMARRAVLGYQEEWERLRPGTEWPETDFIRRHDPALNRWSSQGGDFEALLLVTQHYVQSVAVARASYHAEFLQDHGDRKRRLAVWQGGRLAGFVCMLPSGFTTFEWSEEGRPDSPVCEYDLRHLLALPEEAHARISDWIRRGRGSSWTDQREARLARREAAERQTAAIARVFKRGPNARPSWAPGKDGLTGVFRKLAMNGVGHMEGVVVYDAFDDDGNRVGVQRQRSWPRKPLMARTP